MHLLNALPNYELAGVSHVLNREIDLDTKSRK